MSIGSLYLSLCAIFISLFFPSITNATLKNNWSPYVNLEGGMGAQNVNNVIFENPRQPQLIQNSNHSAIHLGSCALGTYFSSIPLHIEVRATFNSQSNFNREYFFPSFFSVVGVQKIKIQSNYLMARGYYSLPLEIITPYISLGAGTSWNKTTATQYAPQLPGWIYNFKGTTQSGFVWSAGIGLSKPIHDNWVLNVGYNYVALGTFDTGVLPKTGDEHLFGKIQSNELVFGFTYFI
ncbi:outer membrane protein [Legionella jamestowniensis]|uniref:Outer membrane protein PagN n=1 Tax=Legionella jamestowniensis TaxID=455 RepID=A0A0W0UH44_9GAMM|nr:outer membrane beta-barrel protein [Legionella jamestowniensis]KTD07236.1 Outer membrane protein PagN precursor [Legionella jamestowniensis]SFL95870.1 Outer membrane protein beta-barrel domain-containing protein [Legionella jamestowniensis DSM 19215]